MRNISKSPLAALWLTVFIDLLGLGIVIPIFAALFFVPTGPFFMQSVSIFDFKISTNLLYGLLTATYPFAQFLAAPILGDLADRYGRRKILVFSIAGTLIGYLLTALGIITQNLPLLFVSRLIDGFTGGNIAVAQSAIADVSTPETKARNFGLIGMAFGLGFVIGPYVGGKLADPTIISWFTSATPFFFSALLTSFNLILIWLNLPETLKEAATAPINLFRAVKNIKRAIITPNLRNILIVTFLFTLGFNFFTQFFQVYLIETFNFTQSRIGDLFAYIGLWIAITQGLLLRSLLKKLTPNKILRFSLIILAIAFVLLTIPNDSLYLWLILPIVAIFNGFTQPNLVAATSNMADTKAQGEIIGINQSIQSLAQTIPPLIAGVISTISPSLPTLFAAGTIFLAWIFYLLYERSRANLTWTARE